MKSTTLQCDTFWFKSANKESSPIRVSYFALARFENRQPNDLPTEEEVTIAFGIKAKREYILKEIARVAFDRGMNSSDDGINENE